MNNSKDGSKLWGRGSFIRRLNGVEGGLEWGAKTNWALQKQERQDSSDKFTLWEGPLRPEEGRWFTRTSTHVSPLSDCTELFVTWVHCVPEHHMGSLCAGDTEDLGNWSHIRVRRVTCCFKKYYRGQHVNLVSSKDLHVNCKGDQYKYVG